VKNRKQNQFVQGKIKLNFSTSVHETFELQLNFSSLVFFSKLMILIHVRFFVLFCFDDEIMKKKKKRKVYFFESVGDFEKNNTRKYQQHR